MGSITFIFNCKNQDSTLQLIVLFSCVSYLGAHYLDEILQGKTSIRPITRALFLIVGIIWSIVLIALPLIGLFKDRFTPYIEDPFAVVTLRRR